MVKTHEHHFQLRKDIKKNTEEVKIISSAVKYLGLAHLSYSSCEEVKKEVKMSPWLYTVHSTLVMSSSWWADSTPSFKDLVHLLDKKFLNTREIKIQQLGMVAQYSTYTS